MPHMKCYFSYYHSNDNNIELNWFLLTSANLSQAAFGVQEKSNQQIYMKSYELGVLYLKTKIHTNYRLFSLSSNHLLLGLSNIEKFHAHNISSHRLTRFVVSSDDNRNEESNNEELLIKFDLPFKIPSDKYNHNDKPWLCDVKYDIPDMFGEYNV